MRQGRSEANGGAKRTQTEPIVFNGGLEKKYEGIQGNKNWGEESESTGSPSAFLFRAGRHGKKVKRNGFGGVGSWQMRWGRK